MRLLRPSWLYSRPLLIGIAVFLVLLPLITVVNIFVTSVTILDRKDQSTAAVLTPEDRLGSKLVELSERIKHAEMLNVERKREINHLRSQIDLLDQQQRNPGAEGRMSTGNISRSDGLVNSYLLQVPAISNFLPHLLNSPDPLRPAFRLVSSSTPRTSASIVFGIPTVRRPVESYLLSTLENLITNLSPEEKLQAILVVFIAEVS